MQTIEFDLMQKFDGSYLTGADAIQKAFVPSETTDVSGDVTFEKIFD
jgi:hypothetical protein